MAEPPITRQAAHVSAGSNLPVARIVVHATCPDVGYPRASAPGTASGTAKYFEMQSSGGSAHYIEGVDREEHCVKDAAIAWHAPPNPHSIGIEITADGGDRGAFRDPTHAYTREQWLSPQVWPAVARAAARARELCIRHDIPMRRLTVAQVRANASGICAHDDVSEAFGVSTHSDPGPNFPWPEFMALVNGEDDMPSVSEIVTAVWSAKTTVLGKPEGEAVISGLGRLYRTAVAALEEGRANAAASIARDTALSRRIDTLEARVPGAVVDKLGATAIEATVNVNGKVVS